jgi:hypothetical protein
VIIIAATGVDNGGGQTIRIAKLPRTGNDLVRGLALDEGLSDYLARSERANLGKRGDGHVNSSPFFPDKSLPVG